MQLSSTDARIKLKKNTFPNDIGKRFIFIVPYHSQFCCVLLSYLRFYYIQLDIIMSVCEHDAWALLSCRVQAVITNEFERNYV